jgi:hypothetical protein
MILVNWYNLFNREIHLEENFIPYFESLGKLRVIEPSASFPYRI